MSGHESYPPPGGPTPPSPGWAPAGAAPPPPRPFPAPEAALRGGPPPGPGPGWVPAPGTLGAAHKPGALPLRPLGLSDMYDAAFKIIRFNPRATVGSAVLVAAVAMSIPVLVTSLLASTIDLSLEPSASITTAETAGLVGSLASLGLGSLLQSIGLILVTGMIAHVTAAAAVGRRLSLAEAWRLTRGSRWRLIGLTVLLGLMLLGLLLLYGLTWVPVALAGRTWVAVVYGLVSVPLFLALLCWFWIRVYYLPVPALMLEPGTGVTGALKRGIRLTRRQFWRTFGIALLTVLIAQVAGSMLSLPISFAGQLLLATSPSSEYAVLGLVLSQALSSVVAAAFVAPFTTTVASLQYLDQRMRKEAYDVELMAQAGLTAR